MKKQELGVRLLCAACVRCGSPPDYEQMPTWGDASEMRHVRANVSDAQ